MKLLAAIGVIYGMFWALILSRPEPPDHSPTGLEWLGDPEEPLFHNGRPTERIPINELSTADQPEELPLGYRYADEPEPSQHHPLVRNPWEPGLEVIPNSNELPPHLQKLIRDAIAAREAEESKCPR